MPNYSGEAKRWREIDPKINFGWNVVRIDGSGFKSLRAPNIDLASLQKYHQILFDCVTETIKKFPFISFAYFIDDEAYFLFHSNSLDKSMRRHSKTLCKILSYFTAIVNTLIRPDVITSRREIPFNKLHYDGRIIKLKNKEVFKFFADIISHGKMFVGNVLVGDGKYLIKNDLPEIEQIGISRNINNVREYVLLFGAAIDGDGTKYQLNWDEYDEYLILIANILNSIIDSF